MTGPHYVVQSGIEPSILLPQPPKCLDCICAFLLPAKDLLCINHHVKDCTVEFSCLREAHGKQPPSSLISHTVVCGAERAQDEGDTQLP